MTVVQQILRDIRLEQTQDAIAELRASRADLIEQAAEALAKGHRQWHANIQGDIRWCDQAIARLKQQAQP